MLAEHGGLVAADVDVDERLTHEHAGRDAGLVVEREFAHASADEEFRDRCSNAPQPRARRSCPQTSAAGSPWSRLSVTSGGPPARATSKPSPARPTIDDLHHTRANLCSAWFSVLASSAVRRPQATSGSMYQAKRCCRRSPAARASRYRLRPAAARPRRAECATSASASWSRGRLPRSASAVISAPDRAGARSRARSRQEDRGRRVLEPGCEVLLPSDEIDPGWRDPLERDAPIHGAPATMGVSARGMTIGTSTPS